MYILILNPLIGKLEDAAALYDEVKPNETCTIHLRAR